MRAITFATRSHRSMAMKAAASVQLHTGLETTIIDVQTADWKSINSRKLSVLLSETNKDEVVLYFDSDIRFVRDWNIHMLCYANSFIACVDMAVRTNIDRWRGYCDEYGINPKLYFNAGLFIADLSRCRSSIEMASAIIDDLDDEYTDQTALNLVWQTCDLPIRLLPREFNWFIGLSPPPAAAVVLHGAGMRQLEAERMLDDYHDLYRSLKLM